MRILINEFCVYTHDIDGIIFYVGKGKNYRPFDTLSRTDIWKNHVEQNGSEFNVNIIRWYKNEKNALSAETKLIAKYKPKCNIHGNSNRNVSISKSYPNMLLAKHIEKTELSIEDYSSERGLSHMTIRLALKGNFTEKTARILYDHSGKQLKLQPPPIQFN